MKSEKCILSLLKQHFETILENYSMTLTLKYALSIQMASRLFWAYCDDKPKSLRFRNRRYDRIAIRHGWTSTI